MNNKSENPAAKWILPAVIAIGAGGMGVTGTLLWMENRSQSTPAAGNSPSMTSSSSEASASTGGIAGLPNNGGPIGAAVPQANAKSQTTNGDSPAPHDESSGDHEGHDHAQPAENSPDKAPGTDASTPHEPPATLTSGMPPVQVSITLANWYYDHQVWPKAIEQYEKTIAQGLDNPDVRTDLGSAFRFSGQPQKALEQYDLAQKQNPRHENSLFNKGGVYASEMKNPAKAIAAWQQYIQRFPSGQSVLQARQLIAREQAKLKKS